MGAFHILNSTAALPDHSLIPEEDEAGSLRPACVMSFNANDPVGAGGLTGDVAAIASVGVHPFAIVTGTYIRDSSAVRDHHALDADVVEEQARTVLEDALVQAFKVGYVGSTEALGQITQIAADYPDTPLVAYLPDLSWWEMSAIEHYLDAFAELLLPQTTVLVGNHSSLSRWLLPDWQDEHAPSARDLAIAAAEHGAAYVLVTGIALPGQYIDNVLSSPESVLCSLKLERIEAVFHGAGDTLSAALAALLASGSPLPDAALEALQYLDRCLMGGFAPGMEHNIPDRLFWAAPDDDEAPPADAVPSH